RERECPEGGWGRWVCGGYDHPAGRVPAGRMDPSPLSAFVSVLAADEQLQDFLRALPARARVSEPVLPLLLATLHRELDRPRPVVPPEASEARAAAEAAAWFGAPDRVALLPGRGVASGSGLEPPPHLVGERFRALDVLCQGGLVCASARALADALPPPAA